MPDRAISRARALLQAAAFARPPSARKHRKPKKLPRQIPPDAIALDYARALARVMAKVRAAFAPLLEQLPEIIEAERRERALHRDGERVDAGQSKRVRALLEEARRRMATTISTQEIEALAVAFANTTSTYQRIQLNRQTRAALGVDLFTGDRFLPILVEGFADENVALIKGITTKLATDVEGATLRALQRGVLAGDLAEELEGRFGYAEDRAALIARDQIGKLNGQINAARQQELGVRRFRWMTVRDERVTGTPGGPYAKSEPSHFELHGKVFSYDDPPEAGRNFEPSLPGEPINCRCYAEPVLDDILADL
jgi:SPP1 gp7 family putative phage head morphogenesis protein